MTTTDNETEADAAEKHSQSKETESKPTQKWPDSGSHSPNVRTIAGGGEPMRHDCFITDHDRERLEALHAQIAAFDAAYVYSHDADRGELKVRLDLDDEWSRAARRDYYDNRVDKRLEETAHRLSVMNWNHFSPEEMAKVLQAHRLLTDVAESAEIGTRLAHERRADR